MELLSGRRETMRRGGELWESARKAKSSLWILFDFISKASLSRCFQIRHKESFLSITLMFSFSPKKGTKIWKGCRLRQYQRFFFFKGEQNQLDVFLSPGFNQGCLSEVSGDKNGFLALSMSSWILRSCLLGCRRDIVAWFQFNLWSSGVSGGPKKVDGGIFASW